VSVAAAANNLVAVLDGYFIKGGHHINVNVLNRCGTRQLSGLRCMQQYM
jgi:hypothetical protein